MGRVGAVYGLCGCVSIYRGCVCVYNVCGYGVLSVGRVCECRRNVWDAEKVCVRARACMRVCTGARMCVYEVLGLVCVPSQ